MIEKTCITCGKKFSVRNYRKDTAKCCSNECWLKSDFLKSIVSETQKQRHKKNSTKGTQIVARIKNICGLCGKEFFTIPSRKRKFCSQLCANDFNTKENNSSWKGGITAPINIRCKDKNWRKLRKQLFFERGYFCECCSDETRLHVHHITPVRMGGTDEKNNLMILCNKCHHFIELYGKCKCEVANDTNGKTEIAS